MAAERNFAMPSLQRDLAWIGAGLLATAAVIGAAIGVAADIAIHRHKAVR